MPGMHAFAADVRLCSIIGMDLSTSTNKRVRDLTRTAAAGLGTNLGSRNFQRSINGTSALAHGDSRFPRTISDTARILCDRVYLACLIAYRCKRRKRRKRVHVTIKRVRINRHRRLLRDNEIIDRTRVGHRGIGRKGGGGDVFERFRSAISPEKERERGRSGFVPRRIRSARVGSLVDAWMGALVEENRSGTDGRGSLLTY